MPAANRIGEVEKLPQIIPIIYTLHYIEEYIVDMRCIDIIYMLMLVIKLYEGVGEAKKKAINRRFCVIFFAVPSRY